MMIAGLLAIGWTVRAIAQEAPARPLRVWQMGWVPLARQGEQMQQLRVDVFDTEGVCLYVVTGQGYDSGIQGALAMSQAAAIAAVPKTQLPKGTGCQ